MIQFDKSNEMDIQSNQNVCLINHLLIYVFTFSGLSTYFMFSMRNSKGYLKQSYKETEDEESEETNQPVIPVARNEDIHNNHFNNL